MSRYNPRCPNAEFTYEAANHWRDHCLQKDGSIFSGDEELWTANNFTTEYAKKCFLGVEGRESFTEKMKNGLENSDPAIYKLTAELLWLLYLSVSHIRPDTKREKIKEVCAWAGLQLNDQQKFLQDKYLEGLGSGGMGFNTNIWKNAAALALFIRDWKRLNMEDQKELLSNSTKFCNQWNQWATEWDPQSSTSGVTPVSGLTFGNSQIRHIISHFLFPDYFESIFSNSAKKKIVKKIRGKEASRKSYPEIDEIILKARQEQEKEHGTKLDFLNEPDDPLWLLWNPPSNGKKTKNNNSTSSQHSKKEMSNITLNRIFYGPPGTGKTYRTVKAALEIVAPDSAKGDRSHLLERFDELRKEGKVEFVTFHQSFGYEEFIEGIRPVIGEGEDGEVTYEIKDGIFKSACLRAARTKSSTQFDEAIEKLKQRCSEEPMEMKTSRGNKIEVGYPGLKTFRVKTSDSSRRHPVNVEHVKKMYQGADSQNFYNLSYIRSIISYIKKHYDIGEETVTHVPGRYVLIIDEINRGNISRIFGELITLIEDSKRLGNDEATKTTLPYSGDSFGVPNNLYIIGTMNTADRSIALLDTALRRRFRFEEMMPDIDLVKEEVPEIDDINVGEMLEAINRRIEWLYDRDHQIGHSFFLRLKDDPTIKALNDIFRYEILPLLQEYFYDDWSKINQILNKNGFLESEKPPKGLLDSDALDSDKRLWKISREPFTPKQYLKIYQGHITDEESDSPA